MQPPNPKSPDHLAPVFLVDAIRHRCRGFHDTLVTESRPGPDCGRLDSDRHDTRDRTIVTLITDDGFEEVTVEYQQY